MSLFSGRFDINGFEKVCVDNFLADNYDCTAFFLSHFHTDHMQGIWKNTFHALFVREEVKLFCSEITRSFLLKDVKLKALPADKIYVLNSSGTDIEVGDQQSINVTMLPVDHCPGSVLFQFEGFGKRILYTGDFRVEMSDIQRFTALLYGGESQTLDHLYLDTTFASVNYLNFPPRETSLKTIKRYIDDWFSKKETNKVVILPTACIGLENLMIELHEAYKQRVHVATGAKDRFLSALRQLEPVVTTESVNTRIHFCFMWGCDNNCYRSVYPDEILLLIKPSALYFTQEIMKQNGHHRVFDYKPRMLRVAYSNHSSCEELVEFVRYLNPRRVHPCAMPPNSDTSSERYKKLKCCNEGVETKEFLSLLVAGGVGQRG